MQYDYQPLQHLCIFFAGTCVQGFVHIDPVNFAVNDALNAETHYADGGALLGHSFGLILEYGGPQMRCSDFDFTCNLIEHRLLQEFKHLHLFRQRRFMLHHIRIDLGCEFIIIFLRREFGIAVLIQLLYDRFTCFLGQCLIELADNQMHLVNFTFKVDDLLFEF